MDKHKAQTWLARAHRTRRTLVAQTPTYLAHIAEIASLYRQRGTYDLHLPLILNLPETLVTPAPTFLVNSILPRGALALLYGDPGAGKSFVTLDILLSCATATPMWGHPTIKTPVVYICAEGLGGIGPRVSAWLRARKALHPDLPSPHSIPFHMVAQPLSLASLTQSDPLWLALNDIYEAGDIPGIIAIDTFHACMPGLDENSAQEIGLFIELINKLRALTRCTILIIHHTRKNSTQYRGHSSLAGVLDTSISVRKSDKDVIKLTCIKQKDFPPFEPLYANLTPEGSSCVLVPTQPPAVFNTATNPELLLLTQEHQRTGAPVPWAKWKALCKLSSGSMARRANELLSQNLIIRSPDGTYLPVGTLPP